MAGLQDTYFLQPTLPTASASMVWRKMELAWCLQVPLELDIRLCPASGRPSTWELPPLLHRCSFALCLRLPSSSSGSAQWCAALQIEGAVSVADRSPSIWDKWAAAPGHIYHNETRTDPRCPATCC